MDFSWRNSIKSKLGLEVNSPRPNWMLYNPFSGTLSGRRHWFIQSKKCDLFSAHSSNPKIISFGTGTQWYMWCFMSPSHKNISPLSFKKKNWRISPFLSHFKGYFHSSFLIKRDEISILIRDPQITEPIINHVATIFERKSLQTQGTCPNLKIQPFFWVNSVETMVKNRFSLCATLPLIYSMHDLFNKITLHCIIINSV